MQIKSSVQEREDRIKDAISYMKLIFSGHRKYAPIADVAEKFGVTTSYLYKRADKQIPEFSEKLRAARQAEKAKKVQKLNDLLGNGHSIKDASRELGVEYSWALRNRV